MNVALRDLDVTRPGSAAEVELSSRLSAAAASAEGMVQTAITASRPILYGTGFPNGVVAAPVGTLYADEAVTCGASLWQKVSGTGDTGWVVVRGDTGVRSLESTLDPAKIDLTKTAVFNVSRQADRVRVEFRGVPKVSGEALFTLPTGFLPLAPVGVAAIQERGGAVATCVATVQVRDVVLYYGDTAGVLFLVLDAPSLDIWPATLPGTN